MTATSGWLRSIGNGGNVMNIFVLLVILYNSFGENHESC
jgi:hypothetical protein